MHFTYIIFVNLYINKIIKKWYTGIWTLHRYGQVVDCADSMHKVYGSSLAFYQVSDFFFPGSWSKNKFLHVHAVDELHALCSSFTSTYATTICGWQIFSFLLNMQLFGLENSVPLHKRPRLKQKLYQLCIFFFRADLKNLKFQISASFGTDKAYPGYMDF